MNRHFEIGWRLHYSCRHSWKLVAKLLACWNDTFWITEFWQSSLMLFIACILFEWMCITLNTTGILCNTFSYFLLFVSGCHNLSAHNIVQIPGICGCNMVILLSKSLILFPFEVRFLGWNSPTSNLGRGSVPDPAGEPIQLDYGHLLLRREGVGWGKGRREKWERRKRGEGKGLKGKGWEWKWIKEAKLCPPPLIGIHIISAKKFACSSANANKSFDRAFNAVFEKVAGARQRKWLSSC